MATKRAKKAPKQEPASIGIDCRVTLGLFSTERGIAFLSAGGDTIHAVVDATDVSVSSILKPGREAQGKVRAFIVSEHEDTVVVDLPQPTLTGGPRLEVSRSMITW